MTKGGEKLSAGLLRTRIDPETRERIRRACEMTGESESEFLRSAVEAALNNPRRMIERLERKKREVEKEIERLKAEQKK